MKAADYKSIVAVLQKDGPHQSLFWYDNDIFVAHDSLIQITVSLSDKQTKMVKLTVDLIARGTSGYTVKKRDEHIQTYLKRLTHLYLEDKNIDEIVCYIELPVLQATKFFF